MPNYIEIEEAIGRTGLRLVLTAGAPGPFGEAAKSIFFVKGIDYVPVRQVPGESDDALRDWTAQTSAPVAVLDDERPRSGWADILFLAERLAPEPRLIPEDPEERVRMFGLSNEICGERGFAWERRIMLLHPLLKGGPGEGVPGHLGQKYGYSERAAEEAPGRTREILETLSSELRTQKGRGSRFFVGRALSALDVYWATFAAMLEPLPEEHCAMNAFLRTGYTLADPEVRKAADPLLLEHRDFVYEEYLELPLDF